MFPTTALTWQAYLVTALCAGCLYDLRERRLPNHLVLNLVCSATLRTLLQPMGSVPDLPAALAAGALGALPLLLAYLPGWVGAGDVKYFFALCMHLPAAGAVGALLAATASGGLLVLARLQAIFSLPRAARSLSTGRLPYGVALSIGFAWQMWGH